MGCFLSRGRPGSWRFDYDLSVHAEDTALLDGKPAGGRDSQLVAHATRHKGVFIGLSGMYPYGLGKECVARLG